MRKLMSTFLLSATILAGATMHALAQRVPPPKALSQAQTFYSRTGSGFDNGLAGQKIAAANQLGVSVFEVFVPGQASDSGDKVRPETHALAANIAAKFPGRSFIALVCDYYTNGSGKKVVHNCDGETSTDLARYLSRREIAGALTTNATTLASGDYASFAGGFVSSVENTLKVNGYRRAEVGQSVASGSHRQVTSSTTTTRTTRIIHHRNGFLVFLEWCFGAIVLVVVVLLVVGLIKLLFRRPEPQVVFVDRESAPASSRPAPTPSPNAPRAVPPGLASAQSQFTRFSTPGGMRSYIGGRPIGMGVSIYGTPYYDNYNLYYGRAMDAYYLGDMAAYRAELALIDGVLIGAAAFTAYEIGREAYLIDPIYARENYGYYDGLGFDEYQTTNTTVVNNFYEPGSVNDVSEREDVHVDEWDGATGATSDEAGVDMTNPADEGWAGGTAPAADQVEEEPVAEAQSGGWDGGAAQVEETPVEETPVDDTPVDDTPADTGWDGGDQN